MSDLRIGPDLVLPLDAVTGTFGILATKGAGKSNAAVVMAEEMWDAGVPWVAVDPKGDWYGVRSSADGKAEGLAVPVLGGRHGDVPIGPTEGASWADVVLQRRLTCVLDVSQFTKADTTRFLKDFGGYLFRHADDDGAEPLHLFLEEAHEYLPQQVRGDQAELVGTWQRIVKQGRFKGLGCTLVSQRSSSLNKDVLELVDTLIVLRTIGPRSREAIKAWVKDQDVDEGLLASLPTLADGEAWIWSPGALRLMERIRFRRRRTFDSGATPKVGEARRAPATLADVDLAAIKEQMADTIERAKADDPKELRKQIADLRRQLQQAEAAKPEPEVETVEVPFFSDELVARLEQIADPVFQLSAAMRDALVAAGDLRGGHYELKGQGRDRQDVHRARPARGRPGAGGLESGRAAQRPDPPARREPRRTPVPRAATAAAADTDLTRSERQILTVLAQYPQGRHKGQLTTLTGKAWTGGFRNYLAKLRTLGYIAGGNGDVMRITDAGVDALGDWEPLPAGDALLDHWYSTLTTAEADVLRVLVDMWPDQLTGPALADRLGKGWTGGFRNYLSKLRTLELIAGTNTGGMRAHDDLMEAIGHG